MDALHGDAIRSTSAFDIKMKEDVYCGQLCVLDMTDINTAKRWELAVRENLHYNWILDDMPMASRYENDDRVALRYWGGIAVGKERDVDDSRFSEANADQVYLHNHFNFEILYSKKPPSKTNENENSYRILRTTVQPLSVHHEFYDARTWPIAIHNPIQSCNASAPTFSHTSYSELRETPPQQATGHALVTYDVKWVEWESDKGKDAFESRWSVFLRMDDGIPLVVQLLGLLLGVMVNVIVFSTLSTWIMRDLSYKPLLSEAEAFTDEQAQEMELWPLSTRVFFPPTTTPLWFCVCCGTGAHILLSGSVFIFLFRCGVVNESLGSSVITPAAVIYLFMSIGGGYVTGRLWRIFHGDEIGALKASCLTAGVYPAFGIIVCYLAYDVFSYKTAPHYHVVSKSVPLILMWLFGIFPFTLFGGYLGYRHGPIQNFPVSEGSKGYQDLSLQKDNDAYENGPSALWKYCRITGLFLMGGILPLIGGFVEYAYGVAGPIYVGYFSDSSMFSIISFVLFNTCAGGVAVLFYYRQIRAQNYQWWWSAFWTSGSSGLYIFILSASWLWSGRQIGPGAMASYTLWFFLASLGTTLMTGFVGVASCIWFNRRVYTLLTKRSQAESEFMEFLIHSSDVMDDTVEL
jgi:transmembrane 9 superfamily protein 2/4